MAQWFPMIDIWALKNISPNEFGEVPHTIGCKTPLGIVCSMLKAITIRMEPFLIGEI